MKKRGLAGNHLVDWLYWSTHDMHCSQTEWLAVEVKVESGGYGLLFFSVLAANLSPNIMFTDNLQQQESLQGVFSKFKVFQSGYCNPRTSF